MGPSVFRRFVFAAGISLAVAGSAASVSHSAAGPPIRLPAAGELLRTYVPVRAAPDPRAPLVRQLRKFRLDSQFAIVVALAARQASDGAWWYELSLPGRPNGQRGWVRSELVDLRPVRNR